MVTFTDKKNIEAIWKFEAIWNRVFKNDTGIKGAATDMRYFVRSKISMSLVHKKSFSLIWQVDVKLGYVFCQER